MIRILFLVFALCFSLAPFRGSAVQPDEMLPDQRLEQQAREIGKQLRCLVCQNQSIDDSDADLARDLRIVVRERLEAGSSPEEVMAFMKARYGDFVLLKPPVQPSTYLLWFGPVLIAVVGIVGMVVFFRRRAARTEEEPLTAEERSRLETVLGKSPADGAP